MALRSSSTALLALLALVLTVAQPNRPPAWPSRLQPPPPPVWPDAFGVDFEEMVQMEGRDLDSNTGSWHYDFTNRRARFDHDRGQKNKFCQGQNLSDDDKTAPCHLIFARDDALYVHYPEAKTCCSLCKASIGCSVLKPDWLRQGHEVGPEEIEGRQCKGWAKPGVVAVADTWFEDSRGVPCRYHEVISSIVHNITFKPDSYRVGPQDSSLFEVPSYCKELCPNPYEPPPSY